MDAPTAAQESFHALHAHNGDGKEASDQLMSGLLQAFGVTTEEAAAEYGPEIDPDGAPGTGRVPETPPGELEEAAQAVELSDTEETMQAGNSEESNDPQDGGESKNDGSGAG